MGRSRIDSTIAQTNSPSVAKGRSLHLKKNTNQAPDLPVAGYTCEMSSEFHGGKLAYDFDPDPVKILWGVSAQINLMPTRGGQVAYSSARTIGPITIVGYLRSRWDLIELGKFVYAHMKEAQLNGKPLRFRYPERDVDFFIYIQNLNEVGLDGEVGEIVGYTLTCVITQDHTALTTAEVSQLIPGLPENVEWIDVKNAAKIAEQRFGITFGSSEETDDGSGEEKPAEEEEVKDPPKTKPGDPPLLDQPIGGSPGGSSNGREFLGR